MKGAVSEKNLVQLAQGNADFSTLVKAVAAADLVTLLQGQGPFTIFAPTNQAFAKIPAEKLQELLKPERKADLIAILKYHVIPGEVLAENVKPGKVKTANGKELNIQVKGDKVTVNNANIIKTDIQGSNGVIHVIDAVLIP